MGRRWTTGAFRCGAVAVGILLSVSSSAVAGGSPACTYPAGHFKSGPAIDPAVTLTPDQPSQTINFGGGRGTQYVDVVLTASRPLPKTFNPRQLDIAVLRRFTRQSDTLTSVAAQEPTFTSPKLNPRRDVITFTICVQGAGLAPGHYVGAVTVDGPTGVGPTSVALNINAKNRCLFVAIVIVAGLLVAFLLFWRGATTTQATAANDAATQLTAHASNVAELPDTAVTAAATATQSRTSLIRTQVIKDPLFWISIPLATLAAIAGAWAVYTANASWGADPVADGFAVISAIIAAAGFRSLIATAAGK